MFLLSYLTYLFNIVPFKLICFKNISKNDRYLPNMFDENNIFSNNITKNIISKNSNLIPETNVLSGYRLLGKKNFTYLDVSVVSKYDFFFLSSSNFVDKEKNRRITFINFSSYVEVLDVLWLSC